MFSSEVIFPEKVPSAAFSGTETAWEPETVLLVEDDETVATLLAHFVRRTGRRVLVAPDATEGLRRFAAGPEEIRLVVVDCHLPDMPGAELCRRLRQLAPNLALMITSGREQRALVAHLAAAAPAGFLPKPYLPAEVGRRVDALLAFALV